MFNRATKVTVLIEDETGFQYELRFGGEGHNLDVQAVLNQQFGAVQDTFYGGPIYHRPESREYVLKINY